MAGPFSRVLIAAAGVALASGSVAGWHWYRHRPQPELVAFSVTEPGRTRIEDENAKPDPLVIRFDRSAAALASAGKEVTAGIRLEPRLKGTWRWLDDRTLEFRTQEDWPVGQPYEVRFERSLFGAAINVSRHGFTFRTAPFAVRIVGANLYQDPVNPGIKQGVFDLRFSHPVDPVDFARRIELRLAGQAEGVLGVGRKTTDFTVVYDKLRLNASIHSAALPIPKDQTELQLHIAAGVHAARAGSPWQTPLAGAVRVPGLYSLSVLGLTPLVVDNERDEPEQVLLLTLSATAGERDVAKAVSAWVLPAVRAAQGPYPAAGTDLNPYDWGDVTQVTGETLKRSEPLALEAIAGEREFVDTHSFRYRADVARYLLVQVEKNLRSFGGYLSPETQRFIVRVPPFPPRLKILSQGSLLSLSGDRKVVALVRDLPGIRVDIGRVLPDQLQHLVSQSQGDFSNPVFDGDFGPDNLVERFERKIALGAAAHGNAHYEPIDLGAYLKSDADDKRGLFLLTVQGYDPRDATNLSPGATLDRRLVLITDLGVIVKKSVDGSQDVFVQSIATGRPVPAATVDVVAKNGTTLFSEVTDPAGRAHFASLAGLARERAPLYIEVRKAGDLSFLPLNRADRTLDYSRFDVGGMRNARNAGELHAYLFSDRGMYRPGETVHVGMIVKTADWSRDLAGIPLEYAVLDARGLTVKRERFRLTGGGFAELACGTPAAAPTGSYTVNLFIVKDNAADGLIGTTTFRVQEFEPDRMQVAARLSAESADGWVSPQALKALISVRNLFGTPAEHRRVEATLTLTPAYPAFHAFPDYRFYDPQRAKDGYTDKLQATTTDSAGDAAFDLGLARYAKATYRVHVQVRAFEAEGGRSVAADAAVLVCELPYLVGFKADGDLGYVSRGSTRLVSLVAIDSAAHPAAAPGLHLARVEQSYVSVLTRQVNGTYKYESRSKETTLSDDPFEIGAAGATLTLATQTPGNYAYVLRDAAGLELNRVVYTVAGQGNVTRSLDRNAELQLSLDKKDYSPGEEIALSIKAPYAGAGLITIERDHVYAAQWFKSGTTASVQRIRLPKDFAGNGYVNVQFVRDPSSDEIFTSPLSFGIAAFATSLAERTNALTLHAPEAVKPGEVLHFDLTSAHAARAVVFAVDEGILQAAHYQAPDPLGEFFRKRALEVNTAQLLDLILPEFKRIMAAAAPGGDADAALRRNLNPFKRKHETPAVFWSGIVEVGPSHEFTWTVPDSFNGTVKIFAVSVDDGAIGIAQAQTIVRGDFVLTPNLPVAVSPGDEFDVSVGVANNLPDAAQISLSAEAPALLEIVGPKSVNLRIDGGRESVAVLRFRALPHLGSAPITFAAASGGHSAQLTGTLSVRPASPYGTEVISGYFGASTEISIPRELYPEYRKLKLRVSALPVALTGALVDYLNDYPHLCTEQLVSRGFAALVLARRPELADDDAPAGKPGAAAAALVSVLRSRQNAEGGFGLWSAAVQTDEFASVYALNWLIEAREQDEAIPDDLMQSSLVWLQRYAASPVRADDASGLWQLRNRAYATYLLTRHGMVTTPIIAGLRESLDARYPRDWKDDVAAAYLASAYQLQQQQREAGALMNRLIGRLGTAGGRRPGGYPHYDDYAGDAQILYLAARHFPERARALPPATLQALLAPLGRGDYNTLSSAVLVLALDAYASALPVNPQGRLIRRSTYDGNARRLHLDNDTGTTEFYSVTNAGYDRAPPNAALTHGMEILREYLDDQGRAVTSVKLGEQITVRLRLRSTEADYLPNVAVTDLLPGGFEPVLAVGAPTGWQPAYADVREDRVVLYGTITKDLFEYTYRIRATNSGVFAVPPSYAESMYDRNVRARTLSGSIAVEPPARSAGP